jgi:hypothetical protein
MPSRSKALIGLLVVLWAACDGRPAMRVVPKDAGGAANRNDAGLVPAMAACPAGQTPRMISLGTPVKLDLLFMIDDSPSMQEEQANLARNFPLLIEALERMPSGFPDLHLGVVSSDMGAGTLVSSGVCGNSLGQGGVLQARNGCGLESNGASFLKLPADGTPGNFQGDIADVFGCMAKLGTSGCGYEHQLQAVRMALSGFVTGNDGFLRSDAHLAVVYITDEDDCSAPANSDMYEAPVSGQDGSLRCSLVGHLCNGSPPPGEVFSTPLGNCSAAPNGGGKLLAVQTFIDEMKRLRTQSVSVSVIGGWPADPAAANYAIGYNGMSTRSDLLGSIPICKSSNGSAAVGLRLKQFVDAFGPAGKLISICQDDFSDAMAQIGDLINTTVVCQ